MPAKSHRRAFVALACGLTGLRLVLIPLILSAFLSGDRGAAFGLFLLAGLTDVLDGAVARHLGASTRVGAVLDAAADVGLLLSILWLVAITTPLPIWVPVLPSVQAAWFAFTGTRQGPFYDPIGKYYGAVLYVLVGVVLLDQQHAGSGVVSVAVLLLTLAAGASRFVALRRAHQSSSDKA